MVERALVQSQDSLAHLDGGNIHDMAVRLSEMKQKLDLVQKFFKDIMVKDVDYGVIPGTQKPSLYKPGAEKLCELYNFAIIIAEKDEEKDLKTGYYRSKLVIRLMHRGTGTLIAEGTGEANVYESKYRWRWVYERDLPKGIDKESLVYKEFEGKSGGTFKKYRIENADLFDQWNTVLKMAKKRALVDATLSATRSSGIFSQAEDELDAWIEGEVVEESAEQPPAKPAQAQPQPQRQQQQQRQQAQNSRGATPSQVQGQSRGPANPSAPASEAQIKAIFATGKSKGLTSDDIKEVVLRQAGKDVNGLTMGEASNLIGMLQNMGKDDLMDMIAESFGDDFSDELPTLFGGGQK